MALGVRGLTSPYVGSVHPYLQVPRPFVMAHRGFSLQGLENTMAAFESSVRMGVTHVETDVHATRDGALVAFHDARLDRVTDATGAIADLSWRQVSAARVVGRDGTQAGVPLLAEVLAAWPDLRVNIDVKDWPAVGPLVDTVARTSALHRVCVTSFDDRRTAAVRRALGPGLATSPGRRGVLAWWAGAQLGGRAGAVAGAALDRTVVALQVPAAAGALPVVTGRTLAAARARGLQVHVWTVNEAEQMRRLLDLGVDAIITDRPDTALEVLRGRGGGRA